MAYFFLINKNGIEEMLDYVNNFITRINTDIHHYVIIAGSRNYNDYDTFSEIISPLVNSFKELTILSGLASGPDSMAVSFYNKNKDNCRCNLNLKTYKADWDNVAGIDKKYIRYNKQGYPYNPRAGLIRNERMLNEATILVAFWDGESRGTKHMIDIATQAEIPVLVIDTITVGAS